MCVCLYDLAMPICIILDPLDPLIHIEGGGGRARAGAPAGAAPEGGTGQSSPPVPEGSSAPPHPPCLGRARGPPRAGFAGRVARVGRGVRLGPGMSTSHIIQLFAKGNLHLPSNDVSNHYNYKHWCATSRLRIRNSIWQD